MLTFWGHALKFSHYIMNLQEQYSLKKLQAGTKTKHLLIKQYPKQIQETQIYIFSVKLLLFLHTVNNYLSSSKHLNCN